MKPIRLIGKAAILWVVASLGLLSCSREPVQAESDFGMEYPDHFPPPVYPGDDTRNPLTREGFELGRALFYDPVLSVDSTISCASCHAQPEAFSDQGEAFSTGVYGLTGSRNTPALSNLAWYPSFMTDGGINHLEVMPIAPLTTGNEMGSTLFGIVDKLNNSAHYSRAFHLVFGEERVTSQQLLFALAQFQSMMISADSKYDRYLAGEEWFTETEERGYDLFRLHCSSCHAEPLMTDFSFANTGLDMVSEDPGRQRVTQDPADSGAFKVPNLRNVVFTSPYMHDGRFQSLEEVLNHYSEGVLPSGRLDPRMTGALMLSEEEKRSIIRFLETLTDVSYLANPELADPN